MKKEIKVSIPVRDKEPDITTTTAPEAWVSIPVRDKEPKIYFMKGMALMYQSPYGIRNHIVAVK